MCKAAAAVARVPPCLLLGLQCPIQPKGPFLRMSGMPEYCHVETREIAVQETKS